MIEPGEANGLDFPGDAAPIETSRDQHGIHSDQAFLGPFLFDFLRFDSFDLNLRPMSDARVLQGLINRFVGVVMLDIFADDGDGYFVLRIRTTSIIRANPGSGSVSHW